MNSMCSMPLRWSFLIAFILNERTNNNSFIQRPDFVTPSIKAKLRRKNRLMRAVRIEEANALALRIGKAIANGNRARLSHINTKTHARDMWTAVRQLTGRRQNCYPVEMPAQYWFIESAVMPSRQYS